MLLTLLISAAPFGVPLRDDQLAEHRGGFRLPSGIDVAMTIDTQTALDGAVVLRTIFRADQGTPQLTVYVPRSGETVAAARPVGVRSADVAPVVAYDRFGGIQVTGGRAGAPLPLNASGEVPAIPDGLEAVAVEGGVSTAAGTIADRTSGALRVVELNGADIAVSHLAGSAFGTAIANAGNDRAIDTQTTVTLGLSGAGPDVLGSSMLRAQDVTADALRGRL